MCAADQSRRQRRYRLERTPGSGAGALIVPPAAQREVTGTETSTPIVVQGKVVPPRSDDRNSTTLLRVSPVTRQLVFCESSLNTSLLLSRSDTKSAVATWRTRRSGRSGNPQLCSLTLTNVKKFSFNDAPSASCTKSNVTSSPADSVLLVKPHQLTSDTPTA